MRLITTAALSGALCMAACSQSFAAPQSDSSYIYAVADAGWFSHAGRAGTFDAGVGFRFNRHYSIEAGYEGVFVQGGAISGGFVDGYGYLPLGRRSDFSLFATAGVTYMSSVYLGGGGYSQSAFGVRGGGGVEWRLDDDWALRATVRYQTTVVDAAVLSAGVTVHF